MDFYEVVESRRTVRDFKEEGISKEVLHRILSAGLKAPTNDHMRNWHFIVLEDQSQKEALIKKIPKKVSEKRVEFIMDSWRLKDDCQRAMYKDGIPKQYQMLVNASCIVIPLFEQKGKLLEPKNLSALNGFVSIWCCIENIFLAATAEGYACTLRIPLGDEEDYVRSVLKFPKEYQMPCYIGIGKPAEDVVVHTQKEISLEERIHRNEW